MLRKTLVSLLLVAALSLTLSLHGNGVGPSVPHKNREKIFAGVAAIGLIGLIGLAVRKSRRE